MSVVDSMRQRTAELHARAEQSGFVRTLLAGRASRAHYALFLRNLAPAYRELEAALSRAASPLFRAEICRADAIARDLCHLAGAAWESEVPLLPEGDAYAARVAQAAEGDGARLVAHAYVRYLGDLAGGQIIKARLKASLGVGDDGLSFYEFPQVASVPQLAREYRAELEARGAAARDRQAVIEEAAVAFRLNIDLSLAVDALSRGETG